MPRLLSKAQEKFVLAIVMGQSQVEAYKAAGYSGGKGKTADAIAKAASKVARSDNVGEAIARARALAVADRRLALTVEDLVGMLLHSRDVALACDPPQANASIAAAMGVAKLLGLVIDRSKVDMILHKPAFSSSVLELSESEWKAQFHPGKKNDPT